MPTGLASSVLALAFCATQAAALRTVSQLGHGKAAKKPPASRLCTVERGAFREAPLPPTQLLQLSSALRVQSSAGSSASTRRNYSAVRQCKSSRDEIRPLGPLLLPHLKLAFCYIPKVACTQFKDLFNHLNGFGPETIGFGHHYFESMPKLMKIRPEDVTRANGWKFATFTRDPALRYLSAFGSTCVGNEKGYFEHAFECCGDTVLNTVPSAEMIRHFERRVVQDSLKSVVKNDGHWVEQTELLKHCSWPKFKPDRLDFRGHLSGDVNAQVKEMFRVVNYSNDTVVDRFFPPNKTKGHHTPIKMAAAEDFYKDPMILKAVVKLYEDDYKRLPGVGCSFTEWMLKRTAAKRNATK
mmetsp:Transcript_29904/g.85682  ORF Transcript_29904/g.85682 Transcript_29904/m.85682 type:complete len:354 (-) Transcript_29904:155-1216(-)